MQAHDTMSDFFIWQRRGDTQFESQPCEPHQDAQFAVDSMAVIRNAPGTTGSQEPDCPDRQLEGLLEDSLVELGGFVAPGGLVAPGGPVAIGGHVALGAERDAAAQAKATDNADIAQAVRASFENERRQFPNTSSPLPHVVEQAFPLRRRQELRRRLRGRQELSRLHKMWGRTIASIGQLVVTFDKTVAPTMAVCPVVRGSTMLLNADNKLAPVVLSMRLSCGKFKAADVPVSQVIQAASRSRSRLPAARVRHVRCGSPTYQPDGQVAAGHGTFPEPLAAEATSPATNASGASSSDELLAATSSGAVGGTSSPKGFAKFLAMGKIISLVGPQKPRKMGVEADAKRELLAWFPTELQSKSLQELVVLKRMVTEGKWKKVKHRADIIFLCQFVL